MVEAKKLKRIGDLTKADVLRIWTMRAGGNHNDIIAKDIGCYSWVASDVIVRGSGVKVPIPAKIKAAALLTVHRKTKTVRKNSALRIDVLLPEYINACISIEQLRNKCIAAGVNEDTLKLLATAVKGGDNQQAN